jgi:hypothetical protein
MKPNLMALPGMLVLVLACGQGRPEGQGTGAAVEDTTPAPSTDLGTPSKDTAADTGSSEVRMRRHEGAPVPSKGDTIDTMAGGSR